jgi:orotidine-5'-phosphate decarboxylase
VAVTVLTSSDEPTLGETGVDGPIANQVERLAVLARAAEFDGVVTSALEIAVIRRAFGQRFIVVIPGIRGSGDDKGDQTRTMTAAQTLSAGASYIVVGRPITGAADPRAAAEQLAAECRAAHAM